MAAAGAVRIPGHGTWDGQTVKPIRYQQKLLSFVNAKKSSCRDIVIAQTNIFVGANPLMPNSDRESGFPQRSCPLYPRKRTLQSQFDNSTENFWKFKEVLVGPGGLLTSNQTVMSELRDCQNLRQSSFNGLSPPTVKSRPL